MMPLRSTLRIAPASPINKLLSASKATLWGVFNCALVAGPPSPEWPRTPVPATVEIMPPLDILSTQLLQEPVTNRVPPGSMAREFGTRNCDDAPPATVMMLPSEETLRMTPELGPTSP